MDWNIGLSVRWIAYDEVLGGKMQGEQVVSTAIRRLIFCLGMI